ncbi:MAG: hypothetical protein IGR76_04385 [Synechococcales cyanobacterium T60_A2020_003]|nr:hypothetical protein [Synechococcales cyanobacterium T60_A2020_003]
MLEQPIQTHPVNARSTDAFDLFPFHHYSGPNPYLDRGALVFQFALSGNVDPLPLQDYVQAIARDYPNIEEYPFTSHAELLAQTMVEVGKLDMDLHVQRATATCTCDLQWVKA